MSTAAGEPETKAADVVLAIQRFSPRDLPPRVWQVVGPVARDFVTQARPVSTRDTTELLSRTTMLLAWGYAHGVDLSAEVILAPETLDAFVADGCAHLASGTGQNYRHSLRRVGEAVVGPPMYPPRPLPLSQSDQVRPYSRSDERSLAGWARGLPTPRMRNGAVALLGLGLGAGLQSGEMELADASWINTTEAGLTIVVPGRRARRVPVVAAWEWAVRDALDRSGDGPLFARTGTAAKRKRVSVFTENLPRYGAPKLSVQRMRVTWVVGRLDDGVPLNVLAAAAGVGADQLSLYVKFMATVPQERADAILRGNQR